MVFRPHPAEHLAESLAHGSHGVKKGIRNARATYARQHLDQAFGGFAHPEKQGVRGGRVPHALDHLVDSW